MELNKFHKNSDFWKLSRSIAAFSAYPLYISPDLKPYFVQIMLSCILTCHELHNNLLHYIYETFLRDKLKEIKCSFIKILSTLFEVHNLSFGEFINILVIYSYAFLVFVFGLYNNLLDFKIILEFYLKSVKISTNKYINACIFIHWTENLYRNAIFRIG